jgi:hypothetical protein
VEQDKGRSKDPQGTKSAFTSPSTTVPRKTLDSGCQNRTQPNWDWPPQCQRSAVPPTFSQQFFAAAGTSPNLQFTTTPGIPSWPIPSYPFAPPIGLSGDPFHWGINSQKVAPPGWYPGGFPLAQSNVNDTAAAQPVPPPSATRRLTQVAPKPAQIAQSIPNKNADFQLVDGIRGWNDGIRCSTPGYYKPKSVCSRYFQQLARDAQSNDFGCFQSKPVETDGTPSADGSEHYEEGW